MNQSLLKIINFIKQRKIFIIFLLFIFWLFSYIFFPLNITEENSSFEVTKGSNLNQITKQLVEGKVLRDSFRFKLLTTIFSKSESLKKGHYKLEANATALDLLDILSNGKESLYSIYFSEGLTVDEMIKKIKIKFISRLRDGIDFNNSKDLKKQLQQDEKKCKSILGIS